MSGSHETVALAGRLVRAERARRPISQSRETGPHFALRAAYAVRRPGLELRVAVDAGATWVDTCLRDLGAGASTTPTEAFAAEMARGHGVARV